MQDASLADVAGLESHLALFVFVTRNGVVELSLLVLFTAAPGLDDEDVVQMKVEGMSFGSGQCPFMDFVVCNGGEGSGRVPQNIINSLSCQFNFECILGRYHGFGNALQRPRALGNPVLHLKWIGVDGTDVYSRGLGTAEQHMERRGAPDGKVGAGRSRQVELGLGRAGHLGPPDTIGSDLMDLTAATKGQPVRFGQHIHDADAQPIPLVGIHANDFVLVAIAINLTVDTGHHEQNFVGCPLGCVWIDHFVILDDEHAVSAAIDLWFSKTMLVSMVPVASAGVVVRDIPHIVEAVSTAVYVTGHVVSISSANNVEATTGKATRRYASNMNIEL